METTLHYDANWRKKSVISAIGALSTGVVMIVFAVTKFAHGAWFVILLIPTLVFVFSRIHNHYKDVARALSLAGQRPDVEQRPVQTLLLIDNVHRETVRMVNFAKSLGHPWRAIHVAISPEKAEAVRRKWDERIGEGELLFLELPYRLLSEPITEYVEKLQEEQPGGFIHVLMGHLAMETYWEQAMHQNSALIFNLSLSRFDNVAVTMIPFRINRRNGNGHAHAATEKMPPQVAEAIEEAQGR